MRTLEDKAHARGLQEIDEPPSSRGVASRRWRKAERGGEGVAWSGSERWRRKEGRGRYISGGRGCLRLSCAAASRRR